MADDPFYRVANKFPSGLFTPEAVAERTAANAAANSGLSGLLSSAASPLSLALTLNSYFKSRSDKRKAEAAAQMAKAQAGLAAAGVDPYAMYSPDVVNEKLLTAEGLNELSGLYGGDLMGDLESGKADPTSIGLDLARGVFDDYLRHPEKYPAKNSLAPEYDPVDYGRDVVGTVADILKADDTLKGVILGPGGVTGNVIFGGGVGPIPGGDPAIYTGTYGTVNTGVSTGNPVLDAAIRRVLGQEVGGKTTTSDVIVEGVSKVLGIPVDEAIDVLRSEGVLTPPGATSTGSEATGAGTAGQTPAGDPAGGTTVGVGNEPSLHEKILDWLRKNKDASDEEIRTTAEKAGVTPGDIAEATGASVEDIQERWDNATGDVLDTGGGPAVTTDTPKSDANETGGLDTLPTPVIDVPVGAGGGGGAPVSPAYDAVVPQYRTVTTTPGDLAEIKYLFDIGGESIFAPTVEEEDTDRTGAQIRDLYRGSYAQGGSVDIVELALQLLRG